MQAVNLAAARQARIHFVMNGDFFGTSEPSGDATGIRAQR
jgi:hypothetical protein